MKTKLSRRKKVTTHSTYSKEDLELQALTSNITDELRNGVIELSFVKVKDSAVREMNCTLKMDIIPVDKHPKDGKVPDQTIGGNSTLRVFDIDVKDWRSFRIDTLLNFTSETMQWQSKQSRKEIVEQLANR